jgi:alpha-tubulin suppressor-like RCC1 family protein
VALKSDGTVWAWGWNQYGQLGNGTAGNSNPLPAPVPGITNPAKICAGYAVSLALMSNGTVQIWGTGKYGELGQGNIGDHSYSPIAVPGLSNVAIVSAGFECPEALKSDGTISSGQQCVALLYGAFALEGVLEFPFEPWTAFVQEKRGPCKKPGRHRKSIFLLED